MVRKGNGFSVNFVVIVEISFGHDITFFLSARLEPGVATEVLTSASLTAGITKL